MSFFFVKFTLDCSPRGVVRLFVIFLRGCCVILLIDTWNGQKAFQPVLPFFYYYYSSFAFFSWTDSLMTGPFLDSRSYKISEESCKKWCGPVETKIKRQAVGLSTFYFDVKGHSQRWACAKIRTLWTSSFYCVFSGRWHRYSCFIFFPPREKNFLIDSPSGMAVVFVCYCYPRYSILLHPLKQGSGS